MATFYIEALEATTITLSKVGSPVVGTAKYGINNTSVSNSYTYGNNITLTTGQKCYFTITNTTDSFSTANYLNFTSTGRINVGGNLSDLIGGQTAIPRNYCFYGLFLQCDKLVDASNLVIVNNFNSKTNCYYDMFAGCTSLTTSPELPATTLADYCYYDMFVGCTSLTTAPKLPATTLADDCYRSMFSGCTSLVNPPELPATTLVFGCYMDMFRSCRSLATAPELPATTLAQGCYMTMFSSCTSLTTAPELPATTLARSCYRGMFSACISLIIAPELPATTLADYCYETMFKGCASLVTLPSLPATTLVNYCYQSMFSQCRKIKLSSSKTEIYQIAYRIPSSGTGTSGTNSLSSMFIQTGGTFTDDPTINTTYYIPYPVYITYNDNFIAGMENGTITLDCSGKYMAGNIIVTANKLVDITYNGTKIVSSLNGNIKLICYSKVMNGNIIVTVK